MYTKYGLIAYPDNEIAYNGPSEESGLGPDASAPAADTSSGSGGKNWQQYATPENVNATLQMGSQLAGLFKKGEGSPERIGKVCRNSCKGAGGWLSKARRQCKQQCKATGSAMASKAPAQAPDEPKSNTALYIGIGAILLLLIVVIAVVMMRKKTQPAA